MNNVILMGRLTKDPDLKVTESGTKIVRFSLAVDKYRNGENTAQFIDCVAFAQRAELLANHAKKGQRILLAGELDINIYEKDNQQVKSTNVLVNNIEIIWDKKEANSEKLDKEEDLPF